MKLIASIFLAFGALQAVHANEDLIEGMKGLQEAAKDPRMLAKLMEDLNNPEMMAEAKKMMQNSDWKNEMRKLEKAEQTKEVVKNVEQMLEDTENTQKLINENLEKNDPATTALRADAAFSKAMDLADTEAGLHELKAALENEHMQAKLAELAKTKEYKAFVDQVKPLMDSPEMKEKMAKIQFNLDKM